jgi:oligosaccharide repeat unit polymerase
MVGILLSSKREGVTMLTLLLLIILTGIIGILSYYWFKKVLLSPTIISCGMFLLFEIIYIFFFNYIKYEISIQTVLVIVGYLFFTFIGEFIARKLVIKKSKNLLKKERYYVHTSKYWTYFIFLIALIVAIYRFYDLYKFSLTIGNNQGILGTLSSTRLAYAFGEYTGGNILISLVTIMIEISCYTYIYFFLNNWILYKIIIKRNLLPIIGYCLIVISFNNRTEYLKIAFSFLIVLLYFIYSYPNVLNIKKGVMKKIIKFSIMLSILFFCYGNLTREKKENSNIKSEIIAYSTAGIIGLDNYLNTPWEKNPYFGYYTLQNMYDFVGAKHSNTPQKHLPFFIYNQRGDSSNIYTSLVLPIQDYGVIGMLLISMIFSFACTKIFLATLHTNIGKKFFLTLTCSSLVGYMYIFAPIADRFYNYFLSPATVIKYTIYAYLVLHIICKYKLIRNEKIVMHKCYLNDMKEV